MLDQNIITAQLQKLFPSVDQEIILELSQQMPEVVLNKDETLFYQNDPSESLYIIVVGKLGAYLWEPPDENLFIGTMGPGETVGENGLITQRPRSLTIKALTDCRPRSWDRPLYAFRGGFKGAGASSTDSKIAANIERGF